MPFASWRTARCALLIELSFDPRWQPIYLNEPLCIIVSVVFAAVQSGQVGAIERVGSLTLHHLNMPLEEFEVHTAGHVALGNGDKRLKRVAQRVNH